MLKKCSFILIFVTINCFANRVARNEEYSVCFTPKQNCTKKIVDTINNAHQQILVQAYSFTSKPIAQALVKAKQKNVDVEIILDKSQRKAKYSSYSYLKQQGIPVKIDYLPAIAHNKIMILDKKIVITGSFNFIEAAQEKNTENLLIISNKELAKKYITNWVTREKLSINP